MSVTGGGKVFHLPSVGLLIPLARRGSVTLDELFVCRSHRPHGELQSAFRPGQPLPSTRAFGRALRETFAELRRPSTNPSKRLCQSGLVFHGCTIISVIFVHSGHFIRGRPSTRIPAKEIKALSGLGRVAPCKGSVD